MAVLSFCRGIFKLLVKFQLENKDNPSYTGTNTLKTSELILHLQCHRTALTFDCFLWLCAGLSFQDFYQRCREAFLVNSDLTLRTQLTEFRDHKLIRTRKVELCFILELSALIRCCNSLKTQVSLAYVYFYDSPGCRRSGVPDRCCGRKYVGGFPREWRGWLKRRL